MTYLTRLRLKFSHVDNLKFCRKFKNRLRPNTTVVLKLEQLNIFFFRCQFLAGERHNLHNDLCLADPPVTSFDGESPLNVLLCSSDEFRGKINKEIVLRIVPNRTGDTRVAEGVHSQSIFLEQK